MSRALVLSQETPTLVPGRSPTFLSLLANNLHILSIFPIELEGSTFSDRNYSNSLVRV